MTRRVHARRVRSLDALGVGRRHRAPVPRRRARGRHRRRRDRRRAARPVHHTGRVRGRPRRRRRTYEVVAEFDAAAVDGPVALAGLTVEARPPDQPDAVERAVQAAAEADVAIVVVGRDDRETEGMDTAVDGSAARPGRARPTGRGREPADRRRRQRRVAGHDGLGRRRRRDRADVVPRSGDRRRARRGAVRRRRRVGPPDDHAPAPARGQPGRTPTSPVETGRSSTPRGSSSGTATTTRTTSNRAGASGTACRTRRSPTRRSPSRSTRSEATATRVGGGVGRRHEHRRSLRERGRPGVRAERRPRGPRAGPSSSRRSRR